MSKEYSDGSSDEDESSSSDEDHPVASQRMSTAKKNEEYWGDSSDDDESSSGDEDRPPVVSKGASTVRKKGGYSDSDDSESSSGSVASKEASTSNKKGGHSDSDDSESSSESEASTSKEKGGYSDSDDSEGSSGPEASKEASTSKEKGGYSDSDNSESSSGPEASKKASTSKEKGGYSDSDNSESSSGPKASKEASTSKKKGGYSDSDDSESTSGSEASKEASTVRKKGGYSDSDDSESEDEDESAPNAKKKGDGNSSNDDEDESASTANSRSDDDKSSSENEDVIQSGSGYLGGANATDDLHETSDSERDGPSGAGRDHSDDGSRSRGSLLEEQDSESSNSNSIDEEMKENAYSASFNERHQIENEADERQISEFDRGFFKQGENDGLEDVHSDKEDASGESDSDDSDQIDEFNDSTTLKASGVIGRLNPIESDVIQRASDYLGGANATDDLHEASDSEQDGPSGPGRDHYDDGSRSRGSRLEEQDSETYNSESSKSNSIGEEVKENAYSASFNERHQIDNEADERQILEFDHGFPKHGENDCHEDVHSDKEDASGESHSNDSDQSDGLNDSTALKASGVIGRLNPIESDVIQGASDYLGGANATDDLHEASDSEQDGPSGPGRDHSDDGSRSRGSRLEEQDSETYNSESSKSNSIDEEMKENAYSASFNERHQIENEADERQISGFDRGFFKQGENDGHDVHSDKEDASGESDSNDSDQSNRFGDRSGLKTSSVIGRLKDIPVSSNMQDVQWNPSSNGSGSESSNSGNDNGSRSESSESSNSGIHNSLVDRMGTEDIISDHQNIRFGSDLEYTREQEFSRSESPTSSDDLEAPDHGETEEKDLRRKSRLLYFLNPTGWHRKSTSNAELNEKVEEPERILHCLTRSHICYIVIAAMLLVVILSSTLSNRNSRGRSSANNIGNLTSSPTLTNVTSFPPNEAPTVTITPTLVPQNVYIAGNITILTSREPIEGTSSDLSEKLCAKYLAGSEQYEEACFSTVYNRNGLAIRCTIEYDGSSCGECSICFGTIEATNLPYVGFETDCVDMDGCTELNEDNISEILVGSAFSDQDIWTTVTRAPVAAPVEIPDVIETVAPTPTPDSVNECFSSREHLALAIDQFLAGESVGALSISYGSNIGDWCISGVDDLSFLFSVSRSSSAASFNEDLSGWDVSRVTDLTSMFEGASSFNADLSGWDVSLVTSTTNMFAQASSFSGDVSTWNVSAVTDASGMFSRASSFDIDLSRWDVSKVRNMDRMFFSASRFNRDLSRWRLNSIESLVEMFRGARSFSQNLCSWADQLQGRTVDASMMFSLTRCPTTSDINFSSSPPGPFCFRCDF